VGAQVLVKELDNCEYALFFWIRTLNVFIVSCFLPLNQTFNHAVDLICHVIIELLAQELLFDFLIWMFYEIF
jgi:hypothetical protein